jgi:hypothetical protein
MSSIYLLPCPFMSSEYVLPYRFFMFMYQTDLGSLVLLCAIFHHFNVISCNGIFFFWAPSR